MKLVQALLISLLFCTYIGTLQAEMYRWINDKGEVVYGDVPPKGTKAEVISADEVNNSGAKFATPEQIEKLREDIKKPPKIKKVTQPDTHCRRYVSDLNKLEIYLEHTYTDLDAQKASDLRKLIKRECKDMKISSIDNSSRCKTYRQDLAKTKIHLEHTPNDRDKQKVIDLGKQIARECD